MRSITIRTYNAEAFNLKAIPVHRSCNFGFLCYDSFRRDRPLFRPLFALQKEFLVTMETLPNTLGNWLNQVGFVNGNPFATANAEQEGHFLPEYFVDTGHYNLVVGNPESSQTTLIFAPRGAGKTAYRVMLERQCYPYSDQLNTLVVSHITFDQLFTVTSSSLRQRLYAHIASILKTGLRALVETLFQNPVVAGEMNPIRGKRMSGQMKRYAPELLAQLEDWQSVSVQEVAATSTMNWSYFEEVFPTSKFTPPSPGSSQTSEHLPRWWNQVINRSNPSSVQTSSPVEDFVDFVRLIQTLGISSVYVVVDRLDELPETADNPEAVVDLIIPLVSHLPLMETAGAAFKFFLPTATRNPLHANPRARLDRLPIRTIAWSDDLLAEMLEKRLAAFSNGRILSLSQLAKEPLTESLEQEMIQWADGSPRRLLRLGELLFLEQANQAGDDSLLLTRDAWEAAYTLFSRYYPPPQVVVDDTIPQMWVGRRNIGLTPLEHRFLLTLYESGGWSEKERLIFKVWDTSDGVSDQAVSRLVRRIREKIEPSPGSPVYLLTEHNLGFRLEHLGEAPEG